MDRSKVLKGISACADFYCKECPYHHLESKEYPLKCIHTLMVDIRDLLGSQNITTSLCPCCETPMEPMDEISEEENDLRLSLITIYDGLCPICKENVIDITDWVYGIEFNTQERAYFCHKCGYIATEKHRWYRQEGNKI